MIIEQERIKPKSPELRRPSKIQEDIVAQSQGFHSGPVRRRSPRLITAWSWLAATIDLLFLFGFTLVFLFCFLFIVRTVNHEFILNTALMILSLLVSFYMIILRSFLGFTIGDWTCDLRLGSNIQRQSKFYSLKVILRTFLVIISGFVTLPLLSLITGKDWAGKFSGLSLVSPKK